MNDRELGFYLRAMLFLLLLFAMFYKTNFQVNSDIIPQADSIDFSIVRKDGTSIIYEQGKDGTFPDKVQINDELYKLIKISK